jgi:hypothetical protein
VQEALISAAHSHLSISGPAGQSDCPEKMPWHAALSPICCIDSRIGAWVKYPANAAPIRHRSIERKTKEKTCRANRRPCAGS